MQSCLITVPRHNVGWALPCWFCNWVHISWQFSEQTNSVIIHDACRIFDDDANPCYAVVRALNVHDVENVLFAPANLGDELVFFGGEWKKNLINFVRDSRARLCTILLGRLSNWVEELTLVLEETLNYLDVCCRLEWSVEWWKGPQSKYIIARQPEVFTVEWNHTTLLDAIDELDGKGGILRHRVRITIDIVHSTICQLELECGCPIKVTAAFELTVIFGKFDHSIHRIRWIRLDDLVCDTQFNIGPSNVELMLKIVASVGR